MTNEDLKARLRNDAHMIQCDGLSAMLKTAGEAADAIERLEAEVALVTNERSRMIDRYERLEAENAKLREALENILERGYVSEHIEEERPDYERARAALQETSHETV